MERDPCANEATLMHKPITFHGLLALTLTLVLAAALFLLLKLTATWYHALIVWLLAINVVALGYYGYDKARAGARGRRVPELVLHGLVLAGGTLGGYLGMRLFRHKTIKGEFRIVFWVIAVLQAALVVAIVYRMWKGG
jgi:uncharacterized membrane protein YsdA (DUF1294 family)